MEHGCEQAWTFQKYDNRLDRSAKSAFIKIVCDVMTDFYVWSADLKYDH